MALYPNAMLGIKTKAGPTKSHAPKANRAKCSLCGCKITKPLLNLSPRQFSF